MRDFLNSILSFIVADSLTDEEFSTVTAQFPLYDQDTYNDLSRILTSRESVSTLHERLSAFYKAKGVSITVASTAKSNIYLGSAL